MQNSKLPKKRPTSGAFEPQMASSCHRKFGGRRQIKAFEGLVPSSLGWGGGKGRCATRLSPSRLLTDLLTCLHSLSDLDPIMPFQLSLAAVASAVMGCDGCLASAAVGEPVSEPSLGRGGGRGLQASLPDPHSLSRLFSIPSLFVPCHISPPPASLHPIISRPAAPASSCPSFVFWGIHQSRSRGMLLAAPPPSSTHPSSCHSHAGSLWVGSETRRVTGAEVN